MEYRTLSNFFRALSKEPLLNCVMVPCCSLSAGFLLQPGPQGIPIELYCFTNTTAWNQYEDIQADIFDHLMAIIPEFGLRLFQEPAGTEFSIKSV